MHDDGQNGAGLEPSPDVRLEKLDRAIRKLEAQASTWANPLALTRLRALRRARSALTRTRLALDWSRMGTDGAKL